jgi:hypothetical protein
MIGTGKQENRYRITWQDKETGVVTGFERQSGGILAAAAARLRPDWYRLSKQMAAREGLYAFLYDFLTLSQNHIYDII